MKGERINKLTGVGSFVGSGIGEIRPLLSAVLPMPLMPLVLLMLFVLLMPLLRLTFFVIISGRAWMLDLYTLLLNELHALVTHAFPKLDKRILSILD